MKKIFFIISLIIILLVISTLTGETDNSIDLHQSNSPEVVTEDENGNISINGEIVEDVEETNPSITANEEETIIQE